MRPSDFGGELQAQINYRLIEELSTTQLRFRDLVDDLECIVLQTGSEDDGALRLQFLNPSWETVLGYPVRESLGHRLEDFVHREDRLRLVKALSAGRSKARGEFRFRRFDGDHRLLRLTLSRDPTRSGWSGSLWDVTEQRQTQTLLQEAKRHAEQASRAKSQLLANTSHEIRTPLTAILGYAELLGRPADAVDERSRHLDAIRSNAQALLGLVDDMLDMMKIEAGELVLAWTQSSPLALAREAVERFSVRARSKGMALTLKAPARPAPRVEVDAERVLQILGHLISNAVEHTAGGRVQVCVSWEPCARRRYLTLRFEVHDSGPGIPPEQQAPIFEPFVRLESEALRPGAGLGLSIARKLTDLLGGELDCSSSPTGSTFVLSLPALIAEPTAGEEPPRDPVARPLAGLRALLVDDNPFAREISRCYLEEGGAEVHEAQHGGEAVARVQGEGRPRYDLILMDMQMPEVDGYEATRRLRAGGFGGPILALTAHALRGDREECLAAGCDDYLSKPITSERLVEAVRRALSSQR